MNAGEFIGQLAVKVKQEKVDALDKKILYLLSLNARISNTSIAGHLKLSREVVTYRIKRMQDIGVLHGYLTLVNSQKAGLHSQTIGLKLHTPIKTEDVITHLHTLPGVTKITHSGGMFDILLTIMGENLESCYDKFQDVLAEHGHKVKQYHIYTKLEQDFIGLKMLIPEPKEQKYLEKIQEKKGSAFQKSFQQQKNIGGKIEIEPIDRNILAVLQHDARIPLTDLANKCNISVFQIQNRMQRMIQQGIIQKFIPYISLAHFGLQFNVVFLNVKKEAETKFKTLVEQHPYIVWRSKHLGLHNYKLSLFVRNNAHLSDILQEMCTEFGENISHIESLPVFKSPKYSSFRT